MAKITEYIWVSEKHNKFDYSHLPKHVVPVWRPIEEDRFLRWETVLKWYGLKEVREDLTIHQSINKFNYLKYTVEELLQDNNTTLSDNWVVIVGDRFLTNASIFAQITERSLIHVPDLATWESILSIFPHFLPKSILFIAEPHELKTARIREIAMKMGVYPHIEWGVVTAIDSAGLSFVLAKLLAKISRRECEDDCGLDIIHQTIYNIKEKEEAISKYNLSTERTSLNLQHNWRNLIILSHGEGAHANLESTVLCGLVHDIEYDMDGNKVIDGCTKYKCKRVHNNEVKAIPVYSIKAETLIFLSCNGFSVAGDLYPSQLSVLLSAAEGYIANCITTTTVMAFESYVTPMLLSSLRTGITFGALLNLMNGIENNLKGNNSYALFGDPLLRANNSHKSSSIRVKDSGAFIISNEQNSNAHLLDLTEWDKKAVTEVEIEGKEKDTIFLLGDNNAIISRFDGAPLSCSGKLVDRSSLLKKNEQWINAKLMKIKRMKLLDRAIQIYHKNEFKHDPNLFKVRKQMRTTLENLEEHLFVTLHELHFYSKQRVFKSEMFKQRIKKIQELQHTLQQSLSILIYKSLLKKSLFPILHLCYVESAKQNKGTCDRCETTINSIIYEALGDSNLQRVVLDCPICGPLHENSRDIEKLSIQLLNTPLPEQLLTINIKQQNMPSDEVPSILIGEVKDKANGKVIQNILLQGNIDANGINVNVKLPSDIGSDIHTIRFALIHDLDVSFARTRFLISKESS